MYRCGRGLACSLPCVIVALQVILATYQPSEAAASLSSLQQTARGNKVELKSPQQRWVRDSNWVGNVHIDKYSRSADAEQVDEENYHLADEDDGNCSSIKDSSKKYNSSCELVKDQCGDAYELFNYLRFVTCDIGKPAGYIFLITWLFYLLLLLSTTVDNFFVPVLQLLADKLRLPPSIAGMTLLALGNGAPDIFVAFSALQDDDLALMLGALMGAGLFIVTVVLGTVLMVTSSKSYNISPIDFMRDLLAYVIVLAIIIAVAYDEKVTLAEAICFPFLYVIYIAVVITLTYLKKRMARYEIFKKLISQKITFSKKENRVIFGKQSYSNTQEKQEDSKETKIDVGDEQSSESEHDEKKVSATTSPPPKKEVKKKLELVGLTIPKGKFKKVLYILEWPFSFLRWLTIPPCCHDGQWSIFHFLFAVFSPTPMALFLLVGFTGGWSGFTRTIGHSFPLPMLVIFCVSPLSVVLFFVLSRKNPPHWIMQVVLMVAAFIMSVSWLNVIANEVVRVLQALGLLTGISTAILGLTVLAIGNSVADWVADSIVALKGKPEMALASCFGAPVITHVLGLSFALIPKILEGSPDYTYVVPIITHEFVHVKLAWIFLGIALFGSLVIFPLFKFKPPKEYSLVLMYVYIVFMIFSILVETNTLPINLS